MREGGQCPGEHQMEQLAHEWCICSSCGQLAPSSRDDPESFAPGSTQWRQQQNRLALLSVLARTMFAASTRVARGERPDTERARALAAEYVRSWGLKRSHWAGEVTKKAAAVVTYEDVTALRVVRDLVGTFETLDSHDMQAVGKQPTRPTARDLFFALASYFEQMTTSE